MYSLYRISVPASLGDFSELRGSYAKPWKPQPHKRKHIFYFYFQEKIFSHIREILNWKSIDGNWMVQNVTIATVFDLSGIFLFSGSIPEVCETMNTRNERFRSSPFQQKNPLAKKTSELRENSDWSWKTLFSDHTLFPALVTFGLRPRLDPKISCQNPKSEILNFQNNAL